MTRRREFLQASLGGALGVLGSRASAGQAPALVTSEAARPAIDQGVQSGDVTGDRAIVWSRTNRPARLVVEWSTTESFGDPRRVVGPAALPEDDFTARVDLRELPPGQRIFYRVRFQNLGDLKTWSRPATGSLVTPPAEAGDVSFAFSADTGGQGWGIDRARGGMRLYETMRLARPDFFVHCGDNIYADQPFPPEIKLDDGTVWHNLVTPAKSKVAETLDEFRGAYLYNLMDENLLRFNAEVSQVSLWDDHEVHDNWYDTRSLERDTRYTVKSMALLAARARKAFLEHLPLRPACGDPRRIYRSLPYGPSLELFALDLRSYRGANSDNLQTTLGPDSAIVGAEQIRWLKAGLASSRATWKVIANDMPIGLVVKDYPRGFEAVSNADPGPPLGRELEFADLFRFIKQHEVRNVVWLTADVHYCAAHHYDPERAQFKDFLPFWEFVAGPAHAGTFGPNELDPTFGPELRFLGIPPGMKPNRPPSDGLQFYGTLRIDGRSRVLTVRLHDLSGKALYSVDLEPE